MQPVPFLIKFHIDMYTGPLITATDEKEHQRSLMSAVPVKVILMGFNLLVGARGNILMRKSHYTTPVIL